MTSRYDVYDVILVMSQCLESSHSETMARINYPCGSFKQTISWNIVLKSARSA